MDHLKQLKEKFDHERLVVQGAVAGCALTNELYLQVMHAYFDACEAFRLRHKLSRLRCRPTLEDIQKYLLIYKIELESA